MTRFTSIFMVLALICVSAIGCGEDDPAAPDPEPETTGTVVVDRSPNTLSCTWQLTGPDSYLHNGTGDETLEDLEPGDYTLTWTAMSGWNSPSPLSEMKTVTAGRYDHLYRHLRTAGRLDHGQSRAEYDRRSMDIDRPEQLQPQRHRRRDDSRPYSGFVHDNLGGRYGMGSSRSGHRDARPNRRGHGDLQRDLHRTDCEHRDCPRPAAERHRCSMAPRRPGRLQPRRDGIRGTARHGRRRVHGDLG